MKIFKKQAQSTNVTEQPTVSVSTQSDQQSSQNISDCPQITAQSSQKPKKKMSKLKILSIVWTCIMFCFYIFKDIVRIREVGWDAINIITTAFLAVQIILFLVFTIAGSKSKLQAKRQKNTKKWVKKFKKLSLKLTTLVTSILIIAGSNISQLNLIDIISIVVAGLSLLLFVISLIKTLVLDIIKYKIAKKREERKQLKAQQKAQKNAKK